MLDRLRYKWCHGGAKEAGKRLREDEVESFFDGSVGRDGSYLRLKLNGENPLKAKGGHGFSLLSAMCWDRRKLRKQTSYEMGAFSSKQKQKQSAN